MLAVEMIYSTWWWYWRTIIIVIRVIWIDHNDDDDDGDDVDCDATEPTILCCPWAQARPRVFSRPTSRGDRFLSFFLPFFAQTINKGETLNWQRNKGDCVDHWKKGEAPNSLEGDKLHCQGHEGVLRSWPATSQMLVFFDFFSFFFDLGDRGAAGLPLS